jgi:hypothetical protein
MLIRSASAQERRRGIQDVGDGVPLDAALNGRTNLEPSIFKRHLIYVVGSNSPHDRNTVKVGKSQNPRRLQQYVNAYGQTKSDAPSSGAKLLFLATIPQRHVTTNRGDTFPMVQIVETNVIRRLKSYKNITQKTSRGREVFYSPKGRKYITDTIKSIMNDPRTFQVSSQNTPVMTFRQRYQPFRESKCSKALRDFHMYCEAEAIKAELDKLFSRTP